jgi:hypothetical protein
MTDESTNQAKAEKVAADAIAYMAVGDEVVHGATLAAMVTAFAVITGRTPLQVCVDLAQQMPSDEFWEANRDTVDRKVRNARALLERAEITLHVRRGQG